MGSHKRLTYLQNPGVELLTHLSGSGVGVGGPLDRPGPVRGSWGLEDWGQDARRPSKRRDGRDPQSRRPSGPHKTQTKNINQPILVLFVDC